MTAVAVASAALVLAALLVLAFGPELAGALRRRRPRGEAEAPRAPDWDPGRSLRAERRARELLREVVSAEEAEMYEQLGFISLPGGGSEASGYAYLIYPHRAIVAYETASGELLNEYCVSFPDLEEPTEDGRLPEADDVLAKWMALHGGERELIAVANMHVPGRQLDPGQVRRDLIRLREWRAARSRPAAEAAPSGP